MQCNAIWPRRGDASAAGCSSRRISLRQFANDYVTPFRKLVLELLKETVWSAEYIAEVFLIEPGGPELFIDHPHFLNKLVIRSEDWTGWTVRRVEDAVRKHLDEQMAAVRAKMQALQHEVAVLDDAVQSIDKAKARAALAASFPEAAEFAQFSPEPTDVYAFGKVMDHTPAYLVRMVNHEPAGVARVSDQSPLGWHMLSNGIAKNQRLGDFWIALAKSFAARELEVSEACLLCDEVFAVEKPWDGQVERYAVTKVALKKVGGRKIDVAFGSDNLPAKAEFVPSEDEVVIIGGMRV